MTWKDDVYIELLRYHEIRDAREFTLDEFYTHAEDRLAAKYPDNNNVQAKIRQMLQRLRDEGHLEFVDGQGTYRFLTLDADFTAAYGIPEQTVETTRRPVPQSVRVEALQRYRRACVVTDVDVPQLLDAAHVLPRAEYPEEGRNPANVIVLNKLHHTAFDNQFFTIDTDYRVRVNPDVTTDSALLRDHLLAVDGEPVSIPQDTTLKQEFLETRNADLGWV